MKTYLPPTMFACLLASSLVAQPAAPPPAKTPPPEPPAGVPNTEKHVETIVRDVTGIANEAGRTGLKAAHAAVAEAGKVAGKAMAFTFGSGAKSSSRSLAIQTSEVDREKVDAIEEDLSVMARILQKAARSLRDDDRFSSMGVDLDSSLFGSASGARNIYLDGHGALFLLRVEYPLVEPRENPEPTTKQASPSVWEDTKDELLGIDRNIEQDLTFRRGRTEPYDEAKVDGLKTALLDSLKHASNIRHLAPQEYITVVVQGGDVSNPGGNGRTDVRVRKEKEKGGNNETVTTRRSAQKGESILTLRVKKSDVDAYAAGKLDSDGFRQRATIQTYLRRGEQSRHLQLR